MYVRVQAPPSAHREKTRTRLPVAQPPCPDMAPPAPCTWLPRCALLLCHARSAIGLKTGRHSLAVRALQKADRDTQGYAGIHNRGIYEINIRMVCVYKGLYLARVVLCTELLICCKLGRSKEGHAAYNKKRTN